MKTRDALPYDISKIEEDVKLTGFAFRSGIEIQAAMKHGGDDPNWRLFKSSWNDLGLDLYMADGGRYRRRRFAAFQVAKDAPTSYPHGDNLHNSVRLRRDLTTELHRNLRRFD